MKDITAHTSSEGGSVYSKLTDESAVPGRAGSHRQIRQIEDEQRRLAEQQKREQEAQKDRLNKARITEIRRRGSGYG